MSSLNMTSGGVYSFTFRNVITVGFGLLLGMIYNTMVMLHGILMIFFFIMGFLIDLTS